MLEDEAIAEVMGRSKRIAIVGASSNSWRASNDVMQYLLDHGYDCVPINPGEAAVHRIPAFPTVVAATDATGTFDIVLSCDNALPHLLDEEDVARALQAMRSKLRAGGLLLVSIRDYDKERPPPPPPYVVAGPPRRLVVRMHDWDAPGSPLYTVRFFFLTETEDGWELAHHSARYRAMPRAELEAAAADAGFADVAWREDVGYHQPILTARG